MSRLRNVIFAVAALIAILALSVAFVLARPGGDRPRVAPVRDLPPVTEAEAMELLEGVLAAVWRGDYEVLCDPGLERYGGRGCRPGPEEAVPSRLEVDPELIRRAPLAVPRVVGIRQEPPSECSVPSIILSLKGVDGLGAVYRFDFAVYRRPGGQGVFAQDVIYWQNLRVGPAPSCESARS